LLMADPMCDNTITVTLAMSNPIIDDCPVSHRLSCLCPTACIALCNSMSIIRSGGASQQETPRIIHSEYLSSHTEFRTHTDAFAHKRLHIHGYIYVCTCMSMHIHVYFLVRNLETALLDFCPNQELLWQYFLQSTIVLAILYMCRPILWLIHISWHACTCIYIHIYFHISSNIFTCLHIYIYTYIFISIYMYIYIHIYTYIYVYIYI
jgi:hypothetical protein